MRGTGRIAGAGQADGASTFSPPMVDDQTRVALLAAATALQQSALSLHLSTEDELEDLDILTEEEIEEYEQTETDASQLMYMGSLISVVAATLPPPGSTSRGPYNQYQKCTQFFVASLGWPDRQFRHEYRLVTGVFSMAVLKFESSHKG
jgi:hypothetical protein